MCFALIMLIILIKEDRIHKSLPSKLNRVFRLMVLVSTLHCLQDMFWGMCFAHIIDSESVFFFASEVFHVSCVFSMIFWLYFILVYLKCSRPIQTLILTTYSMLVALELTFVVANINHPMLFTIENGEYVMQRFRSVTFFFQHFAYLTTTIVISVVIIHRIRRYHSLKQSHMAVLYSSLLPLLLGIFQYQDPGAPLFSIGLALSILVLYVFVVSSEREGLQQSKTLFLQNMSHEIRTSLNSIYGFAQLLGLPDGTWTEKERNDYCTHIHNSYNMLDMLLNDLMVSTRYDTHKYSVMVSTVNVIEACKEAVEAVSVCKPSSAEMKVESDLPEGFTINSDGRRIRQILQNLLTNAYQFMVKGKILLHVSQHDNVVEFTVTEMGEKKKEEKIESTHEKSLGEHKTGQGLRLRVSEKMAELIGGNIYKNLDYTEGNSYVFRLKIA